MTGAGAIGIVMAALALGYLIELARDKGVLLKALGVAVLVLIIAGGLGAIRFRL